MTREYGLYVKDILNAIDSIANFVMGIDFDTFQKDDKTKSAVVWKIGVIGEATKHIQAGIKNNHREVPWKQMAKMRDKISHFYFGIRYDIVWKVVTENLPAMRPALEKVLHDLQIVEGKGEHPE